MFEDFRKLADDAPFAYDESKDGNKSGMTPMQRFVIALFLLLMTAAIGAIYLFVSSKIVLPFVI